MGKSDRNLWAVAAAAYACLAGSALAMDCAKPGMNLSEMKFTAVPGLPACLTGAVQAGNPKLGPSVIQATTAAGCSVPWHWHTPNEHVMMVSGKARLEMGDGQFVTLTSGGFATMPSKHLHKFTCIEPCTLFVQSDAAFDIHYVDADGKEITLDQALQPPAKAAEPGKAH